MNKPRPPWLVQRVPANQNMQDVQRLMDKLVLNTVCQSACCPNIGECYGARTATFLILGGNCTRRCRFCAVPKGIPEKPDPQEPGKVACAVAKLGLRHAVVTSVTRDDLPDGGAGYFVECIERIREVSPHTSVEVLVPDFNGNAESVFRVLTAKPEVFNHNVETVPRLYSRVRPGADYQRSIKVLQMSAQTGVMTKSGLMVGLGESEDEVVAVFRDLAEAGVRALTIGQYLSPSVNHLPVDEYIHPDQFKRYDQLARLEGFQYVAAGPLVRSSYHAANFVKGLNAR